jgi:two-component system sensor histidine kinase SenX3
VIAVSLAPRPEQAFAAAAVIAVVLALLVLWRTSRSRRSTARRLAAIVQRMEESGADPLTKGGLEGTLARLEKAADDTVLRMSDASAAVQRLASAFDRVDEAIVICDDRGEVVFRNARAGADDEPLVGQTVSAVVADALSGAPRNETLDLFGPPRRTLVVSGSPLDDGWRTVGAVAVVHDVSERRRLEATRRDFVANVGTEVRTPLGALGLLAETLAAETDLTVARRLAQRVHGEAVRVARMVDDLVDLSRVEAEAAPAREPVPLPVLVGQALEKARPLAERRRVRVEVEGGPGADETVVVGDRRQLMAALHALLDNAVAYSNVGGCVHVRAQVDESWVSLAVQDEGIGIAERDVDRVFERFYRAEAARSRETGGAGAGLGLAIARHVAGNHGGSVEVASTEGEGSTFTLKLPAGPQAIRSRAKAG